MVNDSTTALEIPLEAPASPTVDSDGELKITSSPSSKKVTPNKITSLPSANSKKTTTVSSAPTTPSTEPRTPPNYKVSPRVQSRIQRSQQVFDRAIKADYKRRASLDALLHKQKQGVNGVPPTQQAKFSPPPASRKKEKEKEREREKEKEKPPTEETKNERFKSFRRVLNSQNTIRSGSITPAPERSRCAYCGYLVLTSRLRVHSTICAREHLRPTLLLSPRRNSAAGRSGDEHGGLNVHEFLENKAAVADSQVIPKKEEEPAYLGVFDSESQRYTCPICNRKFVKEAASRHVPICKRLAENSKKVVVK